MNRYLIRMFLFDLAFIASVWAPASGEAPESAPVRFYFYGSGVRAVGQTSDHVSTGIGGAVGIGFIPRAVSSGELELVLHSGYDALPGSGEYEPDVDLWSLGVEAKFNLYPCYTDNWFVLLAVGFAGVGRNNIIGPDDGPLSDWSTGNYVSPGIGMEYQRTTFSPFVRVCYVAVTGEHMHDYQYFRLSAGVRL